MDFFKNLQRDIERAVEDLDRQDRNNKAEKHARKLAKLKLRGGKNEGKKKMSDSTGHLKAKHSQD